MLKASEYLLELQEKLSENEENPEVKKKEQIKLVCYETEIYSLIGKCLEGLKKFQLALDIYEVKNYIHSMTRCYESMIKQEDDLNKKYKYRLHQTAFL